MGISDFAKNFVQPAESTHRIWRKKALLTPIRGQNDVISACLEGNLCKNPYGYAKPRKIPFFVTGF